MKIVQQKDQFKTSNNKYNSSLGYLRCIAMMQVILVHIFYHLGIFTGIGTSILLFEMPLFFFITGASNFNNYKKPYWKFITRRLLRIYIPYLLFALVNIIVLCVVNGFEPMDLLWLSPISFEFAPIAPGLETCHSIIWWFNIYILILFVIPFLKKFYDKFIKIGIRIIPLTIFFVIVLVLTFFNFNHNKVVYWFVMIIGYLFFTYIGAFYQCYFKELNMRRTLIICLVGFISLFILVILNSTYSAWDMQSHKFPTDFIFILFGIVWLWFFIMFLKWITIAFDALCKIKFFNFFIYNYDHNSYLIYLGHTFINAMLIFTLSKVNALDFLLDYQVVYFLIAIVLLYPLSLLSGYVFYPLELVTTKLDKLILNSKNKSKN